MHDFTLPANIKQIGSIGSGIRIYMEDYVCTFLHQYATAGGYNERLAYLVGRHMLIDGQSYLFISGAIYGQHTEETEGFSRFTLQSAEYAEAMLDEHFPGQEIVGWMQSQPSYGTHLNQHYGGYHLRQFAKPYHVLFVMDPLERINAFYTQNPNAVTPAERMMEIGGYFIYYEKNVNMHEYMLSNKTADYTPTFVDFTPVSAVAEEDEEPQLHEDASHEFNWYKDEHQHDRNLHAANPNVVLRRHSRSEERRRPSPKRGPTTSLLAGLCAVLFIVSFVMGVGLIRNQDRIDRMEGEMRQLVTAHRNLFAQVTNPEFAPAFAEAPSEAEDAADNNGTHFDSHVYDTFTPADEEPPVVIAEPEPTPEPEPEFIPRPHPGSHSDAVRIPDMYTIQPGDSLLAIALYFFGDANMVAEILQLNGLEDPDLIVAGTTIFLPRGAR